MMDQTLTVVFKYHSSKTKYVRSPETVVLGISRFGGMFAALRFLTIAMSWLNQRQFEKKLGTFLADPEKEINERPKAKGHNAGSSASTREEK